MVVKGVGVFAQVLGDYFQESIVQCLERCVGIYMVLKTISMWVLMSNNAVTFLFTKFKKIYSGRYRYHCELHDLLFIKHLCE